MRPHFNLIRAAGVRPFAQPTSIASFLVPFLQPTHQHIRPASVLSSLSDVPEAYNRRIRRGRGASSGKGKTSGRGHKGQKQHGKVPRNFNGGQTPLEVVHGVRGFENQFSVEMSPINLDRIQSWVDQGRLDITKPITLKELQESRCMHGIKDGVKLLARNADALRSPIHIIVSRASAAAIAAVEAAGGTVQTRYYTHDSIRRVLRGENHPIQSLLSPLPSTPTIASFIQTAKAYPKRLPDATSRKDVEYYRDPAHRGYLSYQLQPGQGPSLFFKTPAEIAAGGKKKKSKAVVGASKGEKIW